MRYLFNLLVDIINIMVLVIVMLVCLRSISERISNEFDRPANCNNQYIYVFIYLYFVLPFECY